VPTGLAARLAEQRDRTRRLIGSIGAELVRAADACERAERLRMLSLRNLEREGRLLSITRGWDADLLLAAGSARADGEDLSGSDRHILRRVSQRLREIARSNGLAAADKAFRKVVDVLIQDSDGQSRH
jgi:hypothetical protein